MNMDISAFSNSSVPMNYSNVNLEKMQEELKVKKDEKDELSLRVSLCQNTEEEDILNMKISEKQEEIDNQVLKIQQYMQMNDRS